MSVRDGITLIFTVDLSYLAHLVLHHSKAKCRREVSFTAAGRASRNDNSGTEVRSFHSAGEVPGVKIAAVNLDDQKGFQLTEQQGTSRATDHTSAWLEDTNLVV